MNEYLQNMLDKKGMDVNHIDALTSIVAHGCNEVTHNIVTEQMFLDEEWLTQIYDCIPVIEKIFRDPKVAIQENNFVTSVELAKKINGKSIQYLSSHTQFIAGLEKDGVRPSRILTSESEETINVYENRFIYALICKIEMFVNTRFESIQDIATSTITENLIYNGTFEVAGKTYQMDLNLKAIESPENDGRNQKNKEIYEKIKDIRKRIGLLRYSPIGAELGKEKLVMSPILRTNIIMKNVDYNKCYNLWLYLSSYDDEGFELDTKVKNLPVDEQYGNDLMTTTGLTLATFLKNNEQRAEEFAKEKERKLSTRKIKINRQFTYKPTFAMKPKKVGDEVVNEYYYGKVKEQFLTVAEQNLHDYVDREEMLNVSLPRLYRCISKINNELFDDLISINYNPPKRAKTPRAKLVYDIEYQKKMLKRKHTLTKLAQEYFQDILKKEGREMARLERMKYDLDFADRKKVMNKKEREKQKNAIKAKKEKINARLMAAKKRAKENNKELMDKEREKYVDKIVAYKIVKKDQLQKKLDQIDEETPI